MNEQVNRNYRDRLFSYIFGREENKPWTLSLYNALNGTNYTNAEEIEINTIENVLYMGMKNDVSFIFNTTVSLYEQQSTFNPNMPIRQLLYLSRLYEKYISDTDQNIYGHKQIRLPVPRLVTFYNGIERVEDQILKLSAAFANAKDAEKSDVEVKVHLINIRPEENCELLEACKPLKEYSWLIETIWSKSKVCKIEEAVDKALEELPEDFTIRSFLMDHRAEVKGMLLTEYDEAKTMQMLRKEAQEEGWEEGHEEGRKEGRKEGRQEGRVGLLVELVQSGDLTVEKAAQKLGITVSEFESLIQEKK